MKKDAIITFDYEVFLGRQTGTIKKSVLRPTEAILKILKGNNAKAIFFVDTTWLLFLKENLSEDFLLVRSQLKSIVESGSSVELHLHPQWLNAYESDGRIMFGSIKHYKLHTLNQEEIFDLFKKSIDLLQNITGQKVRCFRAGGWCIEPFEKIKDAFEANNIVYDFSVVPGSVLKEGKIYDYDFSKVPKLPYYRFENDINQPDVNGCFIEVPLSVFQNYPIYRILNKALLMLKKDKVFGDGIGAKEKSFFITISSALRFSKGKLTLDKTSHLVFRYLLMTHFKNANLIVIVSHPKMVSQQSLNNLAYVARNYNTWNSKELDDYLINEA